MQLVERHVISKNDPRYAIIDAVALRALTRGRLSPSGLGIEVPTAQQAVKQARIGFYVMEVFYEQAMKQAAVDPEHYAGIDVRSCKRSLEKRVRRSEWSVSPPGATGASITRCIRLPATSLTCW